jgi:cellulose synthase/poly-beta-1,6-N-acetylglucosamine synthase-like glycosyltransferase
MTVTTLILILVVVNNIWAGLNVYNGIALLRSKASKWVAHNSKSSIEKLTRVNAIGLPRITLLIAAYHEAEVISSTLNFCSRLRYPKDKLEIIVITEEDDKDTRRAIAPALKHYSFIKSVVVTKDNKLPKGKPRALNEGLAYATGDIIGVLDAEDVVEPDLLLKVAQKITFDGYDVVQGILDPVNDGSSWFSLMERAEYGYWYRYYLEALEKTGYPMPLGGTTNFMKRSVFDEIGAWKAGALTEDFELGMRLYNSGKKVGSFYASTEHSSENHGLMHGVIGSYGDWNYRKPYKIGMLNAVTKEESPQDWSAWHRQRTRWQQGKIQTFRTYVKEPPIGFWKKFHVYIAVAQPHIAFINLLGIALNVYAMLIGEIFPTPLLLLTYINFCGILMYCTMSSYGYLKMAEKRNPHERIMRALIVFISTPAYWAFQWVSDLRAMKREYVNHSTVWFKTEHIGHASKKGGEPQK